LPTIDVGSYSPIGATSSDSRGRIDTNYQLFGNVSLVKGRHSYKAGLEWRRTFINSFIDSGHRGKLVFSSLDDFLSGSIDGGSSATGDSTRYSYQNSGGAYLLDSWRASSKITVNYGIRWDYFGVIGAENQAFSIFNVKTGGLETIGAAGAPASLYPKDLTGFAPRLSVADDLLGNGKLVIRSGAGIFYDGPSQDFFVGNQPWNTNPAEAGPAFNGIGFASPVVSTITAGTPIFGGYTPSSVFTVDQKLVTPRYASYNLNVESQLASKVALQVGYVGSQGRHLFHFRDLNQVNNVDGSVDSCGNGQTITYMQQCFPTYSVGPYAGDALVYINQIETSALSNYNSLQASLKVQGWRGLTSTLNYTWSHSIDTASDGLDFVPNAAQPDDSFNPHAERASSNFDVSAFSGTGPTTFPNSSRPNRSPAAGLLTACSTLPPASPTQSALSMKAITTGQMSGLDGRTSSAIPTPAQAEPTCSIWPPSPRRAQWTPTRMIQPMNNASAAGIQAARAAMPSMPRITRTSTSR